MVWFEGLLQGYTCDVFLRNSSLQEVSDHRLVLLINHSAGEIKTTFMFNLQ
jgi:hypothetical protein